MEMKKLIVLIGCMLVLTFPAFAEDFDLSSFSTDELIMIRNEIDEELINRGESVGDKITSGTYEVGRNIKAGTYMLEITETFHGYAYSYVWEFDSIEAQYDRDGIVTEVHPNEEHYLKLTDGMVLEIEAGAGILRSVSKPSWAL